MNKQLFEAMFRNVYTEEVLNDLKFSGYPFAVVKLATVLNISNEAAQILLDLAEQMYEEERLNFNRNSIDSAEPLRLVCNATLEGTPYYATLELKE